MDNRLLDIKEIDFGLTPVSEYVISRAKDSGGEEFSVTLPEIYGVGATPGSNIQFKGVDGFVTSRQFTSTPGGYQTVISGVSRIADVLRRAPGKTLMYMSMTQVEREEFDVANSGSSGAVDYSFLDYVPLIKICDDRLLTGAWNSSDVINDLVLRMGLRCVCNVRSYWLKQVVADSQSSFFDTIISLVSFLKPVIYVGSGALYILNIPLRNGSVSFDRVGNVQQRDVYNYDSDSSYVKFVGGLGIWDKEKYKGRAEAERESTMTNVVGSSSATQLGVKFKGDPGMVQRVTGAVMVGDEVTFESTISLPVTDETTTIEVFRLDPFGNTKALLSRRIVTTNNLLGTPPVKTFESVETYTYDFLGEEFDRPRLIKKETTTGKFVWELVAIGVQGSFRHYKADVDKIVETFVYGDNGNLLSEVMSRESDCFKFGDFLVEVTLGDYYWVSEGMEPPEGTYVRAIVEERVRRYRQLTRDLYQVSTFQRALGGVRRVAGDGVFSSSTEQMKGRVPKHARSFRRLNVYAETDVPSNEVMDAPAIIVGNPNVIAWEDAEGLLSDIVRNRTGYKYTVSRQYAVPLGLDLDIGWGVSFGQEPAGRDSEIPSSSASDVIIVGWSRSKSAKSGVVQTTITAEGRAPV